jgi:hypothetical protein
MGALTTLANPEKWASVFSYVFKNGVDGPPSAPGGFSPPVISFGSRDGIEQSGSDPNHYVLTGAGYSGFTIQAGQSVSVTNYTKVIGGGAAQALNLAGTFVNTGTGVTATGHMETAGQVVTSATVGAGGTLEVRAGTAVQYLQQGREYWDGISTYNEPATS